MAGSEPPLDCKTFLAWAMPELGLEPRAYARVRHQVCKRLSRRLAELHLGSLEDYKSLLESQPAEWPVLDGLCHVTISRFFRDGEVFGALTESVLPRLVASFGPELRIWSAGCGAGEEPYSFALIGRVLFPEARFQIIATDADQNQLERAKAAQYRASSFRELPPGWPHAIDPELAKCVTFLHQDLRREAPDGPFALVACRNLAFSYFDEPGQRRALATISERLAPGGVLVIGLREGLPSNTYFTPIGPCLFVRRAEP